MLVDENDVVDLTWERMKRGVQMPLNSDLMAVVWLHRDGSIRTFRAPDLDIESAHNQDGIVAMLGSAARAILGQE